MVEKAKILLTGTPVQNNLIEFYSIIDLVQDDIFGSLDHFQENFAVPIKKGLQKHQRYASKIRAQKLIEEMKEKYRPFFLRRTKQQIFKVVSSELSQRPLGWNEMPYKTDLVVWIPLNEV